MKTTTLIVLITLIFSLKLSAQSSDTLYIYDMPHEILLEDRKVELNKSLSFKSRELFHKELDWYLSKTAHQYIADSVSLTNKILNKEFLSIFDKIMKAMPLRNIPVSDSLKFFMSKKGIKKMAVFWNKGTTLSYDSYTQKSIRNSLFTATTGIPTIIIKGSSLLYCIVIEEGKVVHYAKSAKNQEPLNMTTKDIMIEKVLRKYLKTLNK